MDARRQHRIIYQTKIRMRAPGREESVIARIQNLSANGMFVTASDLPDAGTEVQCRLTLGGERRTLRGRVAWVRPASPAAPLKSPGAGIEFLELDKRDSELLTRLVDPTDEHRQPVDVMFEGMAAPIRCQAAVVGEGLRLETRLPFMRLHSEVRVAFNQQNPPEIREGIVDGVTLEPSPEDGVPFLRIGVTMPPLDSARGTIEAVASKRGPRETTPLASTMVDPAVAAPAAMGASSPRVVLGPDREQTQKLGLADTTPVVAVVPDPAAPLARWKLAAPTGPMGALLGAAAARPADTRSLVIGLVIGAALAGAVAWWAWPGGTPARVPPQPLAVTAAVTPAAARGGATPVAAAPVAGAPAPAKVPGPEIVPLATGEAGGGEGGTDRNGMSLETIEGRVFLTVDLEGKAAGSRELRYGAPAGIGVLLPRARPKGGLGSFQPAAGPVRVLARRRGAGSLVRFMYDGRVFQGKSAVEGRSLRLVLTPKK